MSVLERRLQLLLDQHRYSLVETEAKRSGRSVAAVIREAIDVRFDDADQRRVDAAARLLGRSADPGPGSAPSIKELKESLARELDDKAAAIGRQ